ncbi:MAG: LolA family protein [Georgenia sp.]
MSVARESVLMARSWFRWLPAVAVPAVIAGTLAITSQAGAADLPDKTPEDVLALLVGSSVESFSGAFTQTSDLGLPELPAALSGHGPGIPGHGPSGFGDEDGTGAPGGPGATAPETGGLTDALAWLTGEHTGRVYVDGTDRARLQLMDSFTELNVVHNGADVWFNDFQQNAVTHLTLPEHERGRATAGTVPTPDEFAAKLVAAVEPTSELTVDQDVTVAGRDAYALVFTPRTSETLVARITVAVDGETGFPLRVTVDARGQADPALDLAYTSLDLAAPDPAVFEFTPPAGATVMERTLPDLPPHGADGADSGVGPLAGSGMSAFGGAADGAETVGTGWETVLVLPVGGDLLASPLLGELAEPVDGGRLISTALLNALVTDDGRVLVGAVSSERLQAVAGS